MIKIQKKFIRTNRFLADLEMNKELRLGFSTFCVF